MVNHKKYSANNNKNTTKDSYNKGEEGTTKNIFQRSGTKNMSFGILLKPEEPQPAIQPKSMEPPLKRSSPSCQLAWQLSDTSTPNSIYSELRLFQLKSLAKK